MPGTFRLLTWNVRGTSGSLQKITNLHTAMATHNIDVATLQEVSDTETAVRNILQPLTNNPRGDWQFFSEAPSLGARKLPSEVSPAPLAESRASKIVVFARPGAAVTLGLYSELDYINCAPILASFIKVKPTPAPSITAAPQVPLKVNIKLGGNVVSSHTIQGPAAAPAVASRRSTRTPTPTLNQDRINQLGYRRPIRVNITVGGTSVALFTWHAPQGQGSGGSNFSGMLASPAHDLFELFCSAGLPQHAVFAGDMNCSSAAMNSRWSANCASEAYEKWSHIGGVGVTCTLYSHADIQALHANGADSDHGAVCADIAWP